jgi:hypothetical protein
LTQPWQCDPQYDDGGLARKNPFIFRKRRKNIICDGHKKRLSISYETCWNATKCRACHAKRAYSALETFKSDLFWSNPHEHGIRPSCATSSEPTLNPQTGKKCIVLQSRKLLAESLREEWIVSIIK